MPHAAKAAGEHVGRQLDEPSCHQPQIAVNAKSRIQHSKTKGRDLG
jgi:hypothetical protein